MTEPFLVPGNSEFPSFHASTPESVEVIKLLGEWFRTPPGVSLTKDEVKNLSNVYGFNFDPSFKEGKLEKAGSERNLVRYIERDGIRLMAVLAKYCEKREDPVKILIRLLDNSGYDVGFLSEWAYDEHKERE